MINPRLKAIRERLEAATPGDSVKAERQGDCIVWMGWRQTKGYGQIVVKGKILKAHRWAYAEFNGPIPKGLQIDHLCLNKSCFNPDHLEAVTAAENNRRSRVVRDSKSPKVAGALNGNAKLTECQVKAIRLRKSETDTAIAKEFKVSRFAISEIRKGLSWRNV